MKHSISIILAIILAMMPIIGACEETAQPPRFVQAQYQKEYGLSGFAETPDEYHPYYVAATFYKDTYENGLQEHENVLLQIDENGEFFCKYDRECVRIVLWIVDNDFIFLAGGPFYIFDKLELQINNES